MTKKAIVKEPKAVLHQIAQEVPIKEIVSARIQQIIKNMSDTLRLSKDGIGIAAPQIGIPLRIFVASEEALHFGGVSSEKTTPPRPPFVRGGNQGGNDKKEWRHFVFINPQILKSSRKKIEDSEGCLSVPQTFGIVPRAEKIKVFAFDEHGNKFERGASGLFARLLQHEIDHLDGHLFLEKAKQIYKVEGDIKK